MGAKAGKVLAGRHFDYAEGAQDDAACQRRSAMIEVPDGGGDDPAEDRELGDRNATEETGRAFPSGIAAGLALALLTGKNLALRAMLAPRRRDRARHRPGPAGLTGAALGALTGHDSGEDCGRHVARPQRLLAYPDDDEPGATRVPAMSAQKPLELILARNLLSSLSTPAFLAGEDASLLFYNEAAGILVGRRFEETGAMTHAEWTRSFGPFDEDGHPVNIEATPLTRALRDGRPYHSRLRIRVATGSEQEIEASAIPIVGSAGSSGAIVIFWPAQAQEVDRA